MILQSILEEMGMNKIKKIIVSIVSIIFVLILYAIFDIATNTFISTGFMKYVSVVIAVTIAIFLSRWVTNKKK